MLEKRWEARDASLSPGPPLLENLDDLAKQQQDVLEAIALVRQRYSAEAVYLFATMLASYQVRVTERAELLGTSVRMNVSTEYAMTAAERKALVESASGQSGDTSPSIPVPVLKVTKGTLLDNLDVTDHADSSVSVLSQKEARGLVALTLETLFYFTFAEAADSAEEERQLAALWSLRRFVTQTGRIKADSAGADDPDSKIPLQDIFRRSIINLQSPANVARLGALEKFCCFFARNYVIAADIPMPHGVRFIVKYSKTVPLYGRTLRADQKRRVRLGLEPYKFWVPLNLAFTAESYHFRMDIGEQQFVADQYLATDPSGEHLSRDGVGNLIADGHVRIRDGSGLHYAHLYTRGLHKSEPTDLVTVIKFEEAPPGALGPTAIVATISAALVSLMTFMRPGDGPNADTAALLFAVPLFAATLVGYSIDRVQRSSLATYGALAVTGATAFLGAILFGLVPDLFFVPNVRLLGTFSVPGINVGGLLIAVAAISNVVTLRWFLKYKTRRYLRMLQRWDKPDLISRQQGDN
ncbi:MAG: hypothetical protein ACT4NY_33665 [Pseudonocardiales bacterium]